MKEFRCFGPPGCGKTTKLATDWIPQAIAKFGTDKIMVVSFTRTAALKIANQRSRKTGLTIEISPESVGTLHSICFHALGSPKIIETEKAMLARWNEQVKDAYMIGSGFSVSAVDNVYQETGGGSMGGDQILSIINIKRNKMIDEQFWPPKARRFYRKWQQFKLENDIIDFTDLIDKALKEIIYAPGHPKVIFVDEAQDSTKLQLSLIRSWGQHCEWIVLVGDDDQAIFQWAGASPDAFLDPPVDDKFKTVLKQSYRVPQAVLNRALKIISKVDHREPKIYKPRIDWFTGKPAPGTIYENNANWRHPQELLPLITDYIKDDKTVMVLASCGYMLDPIKNQFKEQGIAFHNPYRLTRGDWNPLKTSGNGVSATAILTSFLSNGIDEPYWNVPQFLIWANFLTTTGEAGLKRKIGKAGLAALKQAVEDNQPGLHTTREVLDQVLKPEAIEPAIARNTTWLNANLQSRRQNAFEYPLKVFKRYGLEAIEETPRLIIGTIHSVKGEESDVILLFPDISWQAKDQMEASSEERDSVYRMFYVAMTRAKEELILCQPAKRGVHSVPTQFVRL